MKKSAYRLTESEQQVLDLLWDRDEALTSSEIVDYCENRTWKESYIHILINSLLKKNMIQVDGFKKTTKNYARTFKPSMTREEYSILQIRHTQKISSRTLSHLFAAMLEEETDTAVLNELADLLETRRNELKQ